MFCFKFKNDCILLIFFSEDKIFAKDNIFLNYAETQRSELEAYKCEIND